MFETPVQNVSAWQFNPHLHLTRHGVDEMLSAVETAFTVTFGRAGEDNKRFKLGDVDTTLQGFAGADYDLQAPTL